MGCPQISTGGPCRSIYPCQKPEAHQSTPSNWPGYLAQWGWLMQRVLWATETRRTHIQYKTDSSCQAKSKNFMTFSWRTFFLICKDLITLWKCLKLVTERPNEMRKLKKECVKSQTNFMIFRDFFNIFRNCMTHDNLRIFKDVGTLDYDFHRLQIVGNYLLLSIWNFVIESKFKDTVQYISL